MIEITFVISLSRLLNIDITNDSPSLGCFRIPRPHNSVPFLVKGSPSPAEAK